VRLLIWTGFSENHSEQTYLGEKLQSCRW